MEQLEKKVEVKKIETRKSNVIYLDVYWGRLEKSVLDYGKGKKVYEGNFIQRFLHIGPFSIKYLEEPKVVNDLVSRYLNVSILAYDSKRVLCDIIYFGNYRSIDKAIDHLDKENHNELFGINFEKVSKDIRYLLIVVNSFNSVQIDEIPTINLDLYYKKKNDIENRELNKPFEKLLIKAPEKVNPKNEGIILAGIFRKEEEDSWFFKEINRAVEEKNLSGIATSPNTKNILKELVEEGGEEQ